METGNIGNTAASRGTTSVPWRMHLFIGILGLSTVCLVAYGFHRGLLMAARRAPRVDAVMEIELEAIAAHLAVEEAMLHDQALQSADFKTHLDRADWFAKALLEGGSNEEGTFLPVRNPAIRREIELLQEKLRALRAASSKRIGAAPTDAEAGKEAVQKYHTAYAEVATQAKTVETQAKNILASDIRNFYWIQWLLLALCVILWISAGLAFHFFERRRAAAIDDANSANDTLAIEIVERLRAEAELRDKELKFRTLFDKAADAIYLHDQQGRLLDFNRQACESLGYTREELLALSVSDIDPEAPFNDKIKHFWEGDYGGDSLLIESRHVRKDGSDFPIEVRLGAIDLPQGRLVMAVARDISERKRAQQQLQREKSLSAQIIKSMPGLFYVFDERRFVEWNPLWEKVTGYSARELGERYATDFFEGEERSLIAEKMQKVFSEGFATAEAFVTAKDGRRIPFLFTGALCFFDDAPHVVGLGIDISERKLIEAEREKLIAKLEMQNAELERFTYTVSHDLKSPLITVKGFVGMLRDDIARGDAEAVEHDISRINGAADKMGMLLSDLLELSRIGRLMNPPQDVPLAELAAEAVELNAGRIKEIGAKIEIAANLPVIHGDRGRLLGVMQNLIDNALKYMGGQKHPLVEIGSRRDGDETVFFVRDNGMGIDRNYAEKIFGLFEQLDPKAEGTGIGLALVKRIVEVHGGRIWLESEGQGRGSTFCFTLGRSPL